MNNSVDFEIGAHRLRVVWCEAVVDVKVDITGLYTVSLAAYSVQYTGTFNIHVFKE